LGRIGGAEIEVEAERGSAPADSDSAWLWPLFDFEARLACEQAGVDLKLEKGEAEELSVARSSSPSSKTTTTAWFEEVFCLPRSWESEGRNRRSITTLYIRK
jgi:hypothetical protein